MVKKLYIPVCSNERNCKLFLDDVKKVHQIKKKKTPVLPKYHDSIGACTKADELTDIEFEPLEIKIYPWYPILLGSHFEMWLFKKFYFSVNY